MKAQQVQQSLMFPSQTTIEKVDPRDLDVLLGEIVLLNTRTELYLRFIKRRSVSDIEVGYPEPELQKDKLSDVDTFLTNSELSRLLQELIGSYIMMEEYFLKEMVKKAITMDLTEDGALTSSMVDDVFFVVKKSVRRAMSSSSVDGVCAMLNHSCAILEQDFREHLFSRLRTGFTSWMNFTYNLVQSSIQQGRLQSSDMEKDKAMFLITLNNAETSCDYILKLKQSLEDEVFKLYQGLDEQKITNIKGKLESCLSDIAAVSNRFKEALEFGFTQIHTSVIKPKIKPEIENFLSTNHSITEEEFSNYEANDPWVQSFIVSLDSMLGTFKIALTNTNYETFVSQVSNEITTQLEKAVTKMAFNRLGGLQFDKELRALLAYLTSVTTWTIRDKFARLTQMATVLNLERVTEIMDYWGPNSGPLTWRLTPTEVRQTLALRVDFRSEDIRRLKL